MLEISWPYSWQIKSGGVTNPWYFPWRGNCHIGKLGDPWSWPEYYSGDLHVAAGHRELWKLPPTNRPSIDIRGCQLTTRRFSQGKIPRFARTTQSNPISWKMERKKTSIFEAIVSSTWKIRLKSTLQKAIFRLYSSWGACTKGNMLLRNMQVASSPRIMRKMLFL